MSGQLADVARGAAYLWAASVVKRRVGPPSSWPPFAGTMVGARKAVAHLAREQRELDVLAEECLIHARGVYAALRAAAEVPQVPRARRDPRKRPADDRNR